MIINIATSGRFHLLDLARELEKCGHDVHFYSYVPSSRAVKFGIPRKCCHSLLWAIAPFLALHRLFPKQEWISRWQTSWMDFLVGRLMKPCDVFIAISDLFDYAHIMAKKRFGAITICERGSMHAEEVKKICLSNPDEATRAYAPDWFHQRELHNYQICDYISIPARHVRESFIRNGIPENKLFVNSYGVDLKMFFSAPVDTKPAYDVIFVGGWRWEKGCDLLIQACRELGLSLLHAGSIVNLPFPKDEKFHSLGHVDQTQLPQVYQMARVFAIPSRQEGMALVQAQALASGLPIVSAPYCGGADLGAMLDDPKWVVQMQSLTVESLKQALQQTLKLAATQSFPRRIMTEKNAQEKLSWSAYGKRYDAFLRTIVRLR